MTMADIVTGIAIAAALGCLAIYFTEALAMRKARQSATLTDPQAAVPGAKAATLTDYTKLIEAIAKLSDSLAKTGPALTSLIGAILFLSIAAVSSGALQSSACAGRPPAAPAKPDASGSNAVVPTKNDSGADSNAANGTG